MKKIREKNEEKNIFQDLQKVGISQLKILQNLDYVIYQSKIYYVFSYYVIYDRKKLLKIRYFLTKIRYFISTRI